MGRNDTERCVECAWLREAAAGPWCDGEHMYVDAGELDGPPPCGGRRFALPEEAGAAAGRDVRAVSVVEGIRLRAGKADASRSHARAAMLREIADEVELALEEVAREARADAEGGVLPWPRYEDGTPLCFGDTPPWLDGEIIGVEVCVGESLDPQFTILGPGSEASFMGWEKIAKA